MNRFAPFFETVHTAYSRLFRLSEWEHPQILWVFASLCFAYYNSFRDLFKAGIPSVETAREGGMVCWPHAQSCLDFVFLHRAPVGYGIGLLYMGIFAALLLLAWLIYYRRFVAAHVLMVVLFLYHTITTLVFSMTLAANADYYLIVWMGILLLASHKLFFLQFTAILFYTLSTVVKLHEGWIGATYFSALIGGLPLFPEEWAVFLTNGVMLLEMVGVWFLFHPHARVRYPLLLLLTLFHLYSGLHVGWKFPTVVLPVIIALFGPLYTRARVPKDKASLCGWSIVVMLCVLQSISLLIPGDTKVTMEGNRYGPTFMYEANHQCISTLTQGSGVQRTESAKAWVRCDPYVYMVDAQRKCNFATGEPIAWTFDHAINGGPFLRIVDVPNVCALVYRPLSRNEWIRDVRDNPPIIGYPVKNPHD